MDRPGNAALPSSYGMSLAHMMDVLSDGQPVFIGETAGSGRRDRKGKSIQVAMTKRDA